VNRPPVRISFALTCAACFIIVGCMEDGAALSSGRKKPSRNRHHLSNENSRTTLEAIK
jgi:hypothetical protein